VAKLDSSLIIGRAIFQRWLGTEPEAIAAEALLIKAMLDEVLHSELAAG
jgi:hypothetical protein